MYEHACVCMCVHAYMFSCACVYECVCVCAHVYASVCMLVPVCGVYV